jgi:hypothetical protein
MFTAAGSEALAKRIQRGFQASGNKPRGFWPAPAFYWLMNPEDEKLRAIFKQWRDIEPRADFEAAVRRRIRLAQAREPVPTGLAGWLGAWARPPAWAAAVALVASVILGASVGVLTAPRPASAAFHELQFMSPGTLAGGYVNLAANAPSTTREGGR